MKVLILHEICESKIIDDVELRGLDEARNESIKYTDDSVRKYYDYQDAQQIAGQKQSYEAEKRRHS
jgi:hypothetical protein